MKHTEGGTRTALVGSWARAVQARLVAEQASEGVSMGGANGIARRVYQIS